MKKYYSFGIVNRARFNPSNKLGPVQVQYKYHYVTKRSLIGRIVDWLMADVKFW